jgi:hypothetical protein
MKTYTACFQTNASNPATDPPPRPRQLLRRTAARRLGKQRPVQRFRGLSARNAGVHTPPRPTRTPRGAVPTHPKRTRRNVPHARTVFRPRRGRFAAIAPTLCLSIAFASPQMLPIEFFCLPTPLVHHELTAFRELASARDGRRRQRRGAQDQGEDGLLAEQQEGAGLGHRQPAPPWGHSRRPPRPAPESRRGSRALGQIRIL